MIIPFDRFYDTEIEVYEVGENTYEKKGEKTLLGSVICDIQPYENELENHIYGLSFDRKYKLFCDKNEFIKIGRQIKFGGEFYEVIKVEEWNFGMVAVMRGEKYAD